MLSKGLVSKLEGWDLKIGELQTRIEVAKASKQKSDISVRGYIRTGNVDAIIESKKLQQKLSAELADLKTIEDDLRKQCPITKDMFTSELDEFNKKHQKIIEQKQGDLSKALLDLQEVFKAYDDTYIEYQKAYAPWKALALKLVVHSKEIPNARAGSSYQQIRYNTTAALSWEKEQHKKEDK